MAKAKAKEIKEAPVLRSGGGGGGGDDYPVDQIVIRGKCTVYTVQFDMNTGLITGTVEWDGEIHPFSVQLGE